MLDITSGVYFVISVVDAHFTVAAQAARFGSKGLGFPPRDFVPLIIKDKITFVVTFILDQANLNWFIRISFELSNVFLLSLFTLVVRVKIIV
jgi:hypothetical protein